MIKKWAIAVLMLAGIPMVAAEETNLNIEDAYVRAMPPGRTVTAAFFRLMNNGVAPCELVAVDTSSAERAEIHSHRHENGVMKMRQEHSVEVPAGGEVVFKPGGYHIMLFGVQGLSEGDTIDLELQFSNCDSLEFTAPVRRPGS